MSVPHDGDFGWFLLGANINSGAVGILVQIPRSGSKGKYILKFGGEIFLQKGCPSLLAHQECVTVPVFMWLL